jgi:DNA-binding transcriptional LysR family regulator
MLTRIQQVLGRLYDVELGGCVTSFLCGHELLEALEREDEAHRGELLLVLEDDEGVHVGLYLDPEVLARLQTERPDFRAVTLATEGVSHLMYLSFRADNDETVTQLELELQAEVDKYAAGVASALAGHGVGLIRERLTRRSQALRARLFGDPRFLDEPDTAAGERYRVAHRAAARYCARLEAEYLGQGRVGDLVSELRRFYRLGAREKLELARG